MKPLLKFLIYLLVVPNLFMACGPVLYSNVGHNVPLFQEKGEFSGQVAYSGSDGAWSASGIGIQGAYSVSDKVALLSSFYSMKGREPGFDNEWEGNGSYFEIGGGLFGGDPEKMFLYEAFAGIGTGGIQNQSLTNRVEFINVKYLKPFFQPSVAFSSRYVDVALTPRIAYLTYTSKDDFNFVQDGGEELNPYQYFNKNDRKVLFEPGVMVRGGLPGIKLEIKYNFSTLGESSDEYSLVNNQFLSVGLRFLISNRITKEQTF